jgi:hypothetical protein
MLSGALAGLAVAAAAVSLAGQNAADQAGVTFLALGPDGQPVKTLKAEQLTLRFNGKPRQVASLQLVEAGGGSAAAPAASAAPASSFPAPFGTNEATGGGGSATGRVFMLAIDEESLRPGSERPMKEALAKWIDAVPAGEPIGLTTMARGTNNVAPGGDRAALKAAIDKIVSRQPSAPDCRTLEALDHLGRTATAIGGSGRAAIVMLFTGQITASSNDRDCQINTTTFDRVASDLGAANAQLYIVMPEIVSNMDGIQNLAGSTNSPTVNMASGPDAALGRILTETSAYYVASFGIESSEKNKPGRLEVRAEGVTIRAPKELVAGATTASAAGAGGKADARTMARATDAYRDLPMRVMAIPVRAGEAGKIGVMVFFEPMDASTKLSSAMVGIVAADNKVTLLPIAEAALATSPTVTTAAVAPGKYRIRAAATDASGRGGAADIDIDLNLTPAGPMQLSGLMLGVLDGSNFKNRLVFSSEPNAIVYFQLYGANPGKPIDMRVQLFKSGATEPVATAMTQVAARQGYFDVLAPMPLANLAPGDYQVKVTFVIEGETPAIVMRTLRKVQ